jgi:hypothetical protein
MNKVKILTKKALIIGIIALIISTTIGLYNTKSNISGSKIKDIKLGMSIDQVEAILGRPYEIKEAPGLHIGCQNPRTNSVKIDNQKKLRSTLDSFYGDTNYCCRGNKEDLQDKHITLTYTRHNVFSHPMLWVHLDSAYAVNNVYVKSYSFLEIDEPIVIYNLSWGLDEKTFEMKHELSNFFIDEELFDKSFK